jgi:hypothetical protein
MPIPCQASKEEGVTTIPQGSSFYVKFVVAKCHASFMDEDIVYSPDKYRETEGIKTIPSIKEEQ